MGQKKYFLTFRVADKVLVWQKNWSQMIKTQLNRIKKASSFHNYCNAKHNDMLTSCVTSNYELQGMYRA